MLTLMTPAEKLQLRTLNMTFWENGIRLDYADYYNRNLPNIRDWSFIFIKGDRNSNVDTDHTSIRNDAFVEFSKNSKSIMAAIEARLVFERETLIGFLNEEDAMLFKLTFEGSK